MIKFNVIIVIWNHFLQSNIHTGVTIRDNQVVYGFNFLELCWLDVKRFDDGKIFS